ncbi:hypothetical protein [Fodinicurvata sp. EGI_FJ10296]|uniref:hypothetical protein n=1 Tax=Fodinicurvata sp. EGI_FJ10296 TaxID=3231908 RepID=UPI00345530F5
MTTVSKQGGPKSGTAPLVSRQGKARRRPATGWKLGMLIGICALPFALLALPTTLLFAVGMAPTIVALIVDRDPNKFAPITVGSLNFCGVMSTAIPLWGGTHSLDGVASVLADPFTWLVMYAAAALGWLLYFSVPPAVSTFMAMRYQAEIDEMTARQAELKEEWGDDVADASGHADAAAAA